MLRNLLLLVLGVVLSRYKTAQLWPRGGRGFRHASDRQYCKSYLNHLKFFFSVFVSMLARAVQRYMYALLCPRTACPPPNTHTHTQNPCPGTDGRTHLVVGEYEAREVRQRRAEVLRYLGDVVVAEEERGQALVAGEVLELLDLVVREVHGVELILRHLCVVVDMYERIRI